MVFEFVDKVSDAKKYSDILHTAKHIDCARCNYDEREAWVQKVKEDTKSTDKTTNIDQNGVKSTHTIKKVTVVRGHLDDVIGVVREW